VFGRIDHVGVAVEDLDAAIALYEGQFEMPLVHRETVEAFGVEAVLLDVGESHVELISTRSTTSTPRSSGSPPPGSIGSTSSRGPGSARAASPSSTPALPAGC